MLAVSLGTRMDGCVVCSTPEAPGASRKQGASVVDPAFPDAE